MDEENTTFVEPLNKNFREPKIRFPEFHTSWDEKTFRKVIYASGRKLMKDENYESYSVSNTYGFIKQTEQFKNGGMVAQADKTKCIVVEPNSFAYNPARLDVGSIGYQNLNQNVIVSPMYVIFKANNSLVDDGFLWHYLKSDNFNKIVRRNQEGGVRTCFNFDKLCETKIYLPSIIEQKKIARFVDCLTDLNVILESKLDVLKKYKEGLVQKGFKLLECNSDKIKFSDLFKPFNIRNKDLLPQYTVGKSGLKSLDEGNYDISNHKTFSNDCLILGIGIEEIGISENLNGSISPVYSVYKIKNPDQTKYFKYFLKPYLWKNKKYFTRKSTRREYEIDPSELSDIKIQVPNNKIFDFLIKSLEAIDDLIEAQEKTLDNIISIKNFLIKGMFI